VVFLGPSLALTQAQAILDATYLGPARQGDVYRALRKNHFDVVGLVDGYFHQSPSVWHKEILWAITQGVHVLGAASMGALRAAELDAFGMRGVGQIYASYQCGQFVLPLGRASAHESFEDDDEVALLHAPDEMNYLAATEPLVNIRATIAAAAQAGCLSVMQAQDLIKFAKGLHYSERTWSSINTRVDEKISDAASAKAFFNDCRVDLKADDARRLLREMGAINSPPPAAQFDFANTQGWADLVHACRQDSR
jgi:hypothetical protein